MKHLLDKNRKWAADMRAETPDFFDQLAKQQRPKILWIGCSDSRVPATEICGMMPGEMFVHRNVANVVVHTDFNCLSVLQYAVEVLKVTDVIVCGHYGCGGVAGALGTQAFGLIDNWLRNIKDVAVLHAAELKALPEAEKVDRLCELNVLVQVANVCHTTIVMDAWSRGQALSVHGWVYGLHDGLLKDLGMSVSAPDQLPPIYQLG